MQKAKFESKKQQKVDEKQETGNGKQETGNRKQNLKKFKEEKHSNSQRGPYNCASSASMLLNLISEIF